MCHFLFRREYGNGGGTAMLGVRKSSKCSGRFDGVETSGGRDEEALRVDGASGHLSSYSVWRSCRGEANS